MVNHYYHVRIRVPRGTSRAILTRLKRGLAACQFERSHDTVTRGLVSLHGKYPSAAARYVVPFCHLHGLVEFKRR